MKIKSLIFILSSVVIGIASFFVWYYLNEIAPFGGKTVVTTAVSDKLQIKFLYDIGGGVTEELKEPNDAAFDELGRVYIADTLNSKIKVYDPNGKFLYEFGEQGEKEGQLNYPVGILIHENLVYVSDVRNNSVQIFDKKGTFIKTFLTNGGDEKIGYVTPVALANDDQGRILISDILGHRILVFTDDGSLITTIGKPGQGNGEFAYPNGIAVDQEGRIFVADSNNARVQLFDKDGNFIKAFNGGDKDGKHVFSSPTGIEIINNKLIVVDTLTHSLRVFNLEGEPLETIGGRGVGENEYNFPSGMAVAGGRLAVVDQKNNRVQVMSQ